MHELKTSANPLPKNGAALENIERRLGVMEANDRRKPSMMRRSIKKRKVGTSRHSKNTNTRSPYYTLTSSYQVDKIHSKRSGYESYSSSEDDYLDKNYVMGHEESNSLAKILPFHYRPTGSQHTGLRSIKPANKRFDKLMSYRSNWIMITTNKRSSRAKAEVIVQIKSLNVTLKNHTIDKKNPIRAFDVLARFVNEADMFDRSETQTFIALPTFLSEQAETQFPTNLSCASRNSDTTCWAEAIQ